MQTANPRSYNKKESKGRLLQKQYVPRFSKKDIEAMEKSGEYTSIQIAQAKRQTKVIYHLNVSDIKSPLEKHLAGE